MSWKNNRYVVIPSYKRHDMIIKKTMGLCNKFNIPSSNIYLFIVDDIDEINNYSKLKETFNNINIIKGPLGLTNMRNFITLFFPENTELIHMDDDIDEIYEYDEEIQKLLPYTSEKFINFINSAFDLCYKNNACLFGIYPVKNPFFMKDLPIITYDLRFCVGAFWGCINKHNIILKLTEKEDFERTLLFYINHGNNIIRFNRITIKTNYYKNKGGMQANNIDRYELSKESCLYLKNVYPNYIKTILIKKNGMTEIRLRTGCTNNI